MLRPILFFISLWLVIASISSLRADDGRNAKYQEILHHHVEDSTRCRQLLDYAVIVVDSLNDYNFGLQIYEKINSILDQHDDPYLHLKLYYDWGYAYYQKGKHVEADKLFVKALDSKVVDHDPEFKAKILNNAGANLHDMKVLKRAMNYYNQAMELYIKLQKPKGIGYVYLNMCNLSIMAGNYAEAEMLLNKGIKILLQNNLIEDSNTLIAIKADILKKLGKRDSAILLLKGILKPPFKAPPKKPNFYAHICLDISKNYADVDNWDSSLLYLNKGKHSADSLGFFEQISGSYYFSIAYCYDMKEQFDSAVYYYKLALKTRGGVINHRYLYENIADIYMNEKQYDSAFAYKDAAIRYSDSLYASELKEHIAFENQRIRLIENGYKNDIKAAMQERSLQQLSKRNYILISIVLVLIIGVMLFFIYFRQYRLKIKKEHLQSELDFLKAQLNPHFLFNSINNIYVLIDENKDRASEVLLKFSELMRYQLYECNVSAILLSKELQFLENYIEFENLRYSNKINVHYTICGDVAHNLTIAPLLLQPFLENAFKHTPKKKDLPSRIDARIAVTGQELLFEVINTVDNDKASELPGGIGLENVKKRLKLLYSGMHELKITKTKTLYTVTLKLKLAHD